MSTYRTVILWTVQDGENPPDLADKLAAYLSDIGIPAGTTADEGTPDDPNTIWLPGSIPVVARCISIRTESEASHAD